MIIVENSVVGLGVYMVVVVFRCDADILNLGTKTCSSAYPGGLEEVELEEAATFFETHFVKKYLASNYATRHMLVRQGWIKLG